MHETKARQVVKDMTPPLISLCLIVKDEAHQIEKCLQSVLSVIDEIIVVDTGSTDGTQEICRQYGAKVIEVPWENSFAKARNIGLQHAVGEWILWMDADEELSGDDQDVLRQAVISSKSNALFLKVIHYLGTKKEEASPQHSFRLAQIRLFRNKKGFRFEKDIHETIIWPDGADLTQLVPLLPVEIHHFGFMDDSISFKQKVQRNIELLLREQEKPDHEPWCEYHLANELYRAGKWEQAFVLVNIAIEGFLTKKQLPPSLLYQLKYEILFRHGSMRGAWPGIERAIQLYPNYVDLHFYKGVFLMEHGMYEEAINVFEHCLTLGEEHWEHLSLRGMGSFYAFSYLGSCMERLGKKPEAEVYHQFSAGLVQENWPKPALSIANEE